MISDFAFVCDYADVGAKVNALGIGFDAIAASQMPYKHPLFFLVIQFRGTSIEAGDKKIDVHLIDDDGKDIIPVLSGTFALPKPLHDTECTARLAMRFNNVEFPAYGIYSIRAAVDGHELVRIPITVAQMPAQPDRQDQSR